MSHKTRQHKGRSRFMAKLPSINPMLTGTKPHADMSPPQNDGTSPFSGEQVLKKETVDEMFTNQIPDMPDFARQVRKQVSSRVLRPSQSMIQESSCQAAAVPTISCLTCNYPIESFPTPFGQFSMLTKHALFVSSSAHAVHILYSTAKQRQQD